LKSSWKLRSPVHVVGGEMICGAVAMSSMRSEDAGATSIELGVSVTGTIQEKPSGSPVKAISTVAVIAPFGCTSKRMRSAF
jgi:hypothetical protein